MSIHPRHDVLPPLTGALVLGVLSTFGDWLWTHFLEDGAILPGVIHGMVFFLALAMLLAFWAGTPRAWKILVPSLPFVGLGIAAAFYPVAYAVGYLGGLLVAWVAMWLALALVQRIALGRSESLKRALVRGVLAAVGSGLAFWLVSGMWTQPSPDGPDYARHVVYWTFAFLPGLWALLAGRRADGVG